MYDVADSCVNVYDTCKTLPVSAGSFNVLSKSLKSLCHRFVLSLYSCVYCETVNKIETFKWQFLDMLTEKWSPLFG